MQVINNCPFCSKRSRSGKREVNGEILYYVECCECGATTAWYETLQSAIEDWNKRVDLVAEDYNGMLSCPCCGGNGMIYSSEFEGLPFYAVTCDECNITAEGAYNEHEAIKKWNKRYG